MSDEKTTLYGFADLSEITGMSTSTLSTLLHRGRKNRAAGKDFPNDIPEPDGRFGTSPVWKHDTIHAWLTERASGDGAARVKRAVDPDKSLDKGKAVPVKAKAKKTTDAPKPAAKKAAPAKKEEPVEKADVVEEVKAVVTASVNGNAPTVDVTSPTRSETKTLIGRLKGLRARR